MQENCVRPPSFWPIRTLIQVIDWHKIRNFRCAWEYEYEISTRLQALHYPHHQPILLLDLPSLLRVLKGLGLQGSSQNNAGLQDGKFGALGLHCFTPGLHLAENSIFVRAPSRERLWAPRQKIQGSKDPPLGPCLLMKQHEGVRALEASLVCNLKVGLVV